MDYTRWQGLSFANVLEYNMLAVEMTEDLAVQLAEAGNKIARSLPANYTFAALVTNANSKKYLQVQTDDLRKNPEWFSNVKLYEVGEDQKPLAKDPVVVSWDAIGEAVKQFL